MSGVTLSRITKSYGALQVVHGIDLDVAEKEFVVLVGPSGCGKSTTLRMIAGLEEITSGDLTIYEKRMNRVAPKDRDVAMVFQNYALYPHLNVADNMAFGLRIRKMPKDEIKTTIADVAEVLGLTPYLDRRPAIVVMNDGRIEQVGSPMELFNNPANTFVAGFLGSPPMNQMKGVLTETGAMIDGTELKLNGKINGHAGRDVIVGVRPEHVTLSPDAGTSALPIALDLVEPLGSEALLHARFGGEELVFKADTNGDIDHLSGVEAVHVPADLVKLFDAETGRALNLGG